MIPLHVHSTTETGGAASVARALHRSQREAGTDARFVAGWGPSDPTQEVFSFGESRNVDRFNVALFRAAAVEGPFNLRRWHKFLASEMFTSADVIHLHNAHGYYLPHAILDKLTDKPCVWTLHDFWAMTGRCASPADCQGYKSGCPSCPHKLRYPGALRDRAARGFKQRHRLWGKENVIFATPTEATRQQFLSQGMDAARTHTIPNPIFFPERLVTGSISAEKIKARAHLGIGSTQKVILYASRRLADPLKGFPTAFEALRNLGERPDICAVFIGETGSDTKSQIKQLRMDTRVTGLISEPEVMFDHLLAADIVIAPSQSETFGLLLGEAAIAGAAIIASDLPAFREVLNLPEERPWLRLISERESEAYGTQLAEFLKTKPQPTERDVRTFQGRYQPSSIAAKYLELYEEVLAAAAPT